MNTPVRTLAIIGGGSVATSFLCQFLDSLAADQTYCLRVLIFEPEGVIGPGQAYQDDSNTNLLNIPASSMSANSKQRDDFVRWLLSCPNYYLERFGVKGIDPADFYPRPLFGAYLRDVFRRCQRFAPLLGISVEHIQARVTDIEMSGEAPTNPVIIGSDDGNRVAVDRVVLCNGNLPSVSFSELYANFRYFNSPYPVKSLTTNVGADDRVCIIGTSLSAVDAIVALARGGHRGSIVAISRSGRLPSVKSPHNVPVALGSLCAVSLSRILDEQEGATLEDMIAMLHDALVAMGGVYEKEDVCGSSHGDALIALSEELARSRSGPRPWQTVAAATNEHIEHLWRALSESERQRFLREFRSLWMARRATFPLKNAEQIYSLLASGQLSIIDGFDGFGEPDDSVPFVVCRKTGAEALEEIECDWLVNATSFSTVIHTTRDPLVRKLMERGIAREDPLGGILLDFDTGCLVNSAGHVDLRISLIGSLATGTYFWTTSMDVNARLAGRQAESLAADINDQLRKSSACA